MEKRKWNKTERAKREVLCRNKKKSTPEAENEVVVGKREKSGDVCDTGDTATRISYQLMTAGWGTEPEASKAPRQQ